MSEQTRFYEIIANEAIMGIMAFDPGSRRCVYINRLAREILEMGFGFGDRLIDENIDLHVSELMPAEGRPGIGRAFSEEMLKIEGLQQDILMKKKSGLLLIANIGVKHIRVNDGTDRILVMFQDITIQKKLQREVQAKQDEIHKAFTELLEQNKQLKELDQAKDKFIALTTHELRTPLSAIVATAEVLQLGLHESEEQKAEFINTVHEQALALMELVNDILDLAKIRAGKMDYFVERIEMYPLVVKLAGNFDHMATQMKVGLKVEAPSEPLMAYVDTLRLKEVINNVLSNAIKYNREGGSVIVLFEEREGIVRLTVRDTGVGIAADKLKHVFNEFETVGHVNRHHKGTGLGMPISKRLVQGMGGDITLESEEGVGSSFFIDIPTAKVLDEEMYRSRPDAWGDLAD
jgi:signal transduction histidine kinase